MLVVYGYQCHLTNQIPPYMICLAELNEFLLGPNKMKWTKLDPCYAWMESDLEGFNHDKVY